MTKIEIERVNDSYALLAKNEEGTSLMMDAAEDLGGQKKGMRPMQVLLASLGGCTAIDVIEILRKQRQSLRDIRLSLSGERYEGREARPYKKIHVHFNIYGNVEPDKAQKAIELSMEKYCSVGKTLEKTAAITHSFEIIP